MSIVNQHSQARPERLINIEAKCSVEVCPERLSVLRSKFVLNQI